MQAHSHLAHGRACIALPVLAGTLKPMPGRPKDQDRFRLASGRQLWRLNQLGRLRLVDDGPPISSNEAKVLIAAEFDRWAGQRDARAVSSASLPSSRRRAYERRARPA